jgi:accessory Sec system S-layer assembly protein
MLSFFKKKNNKKQGTDSVIDSKKLLGDEATDTGDTSGASVTTELYYTPDMKISQEDRYYFQFLHNELPALKPNQIALAGIELKQEGTEWHIIAFVRNSVAPGVSFTHIPLTLVGPNGEKLGQKTFDLSFLGQLPGNTSTPWMFIFNESDMLTKDIPAEGWKLAFEIRPPHKLDLSETWEQNLPQGDKDSLKKLVEETLPPPKVGEVNFVGMQAKLNEDGSLRTTVLIRNGNHFDINLQQVPLFVEDINGLIVAQGVFELQDFGVKSNASKPWTFIFPAEMVTKEPMDLSKWKVYPPQSTLEK